MISLAWKILWSQRARSYVTGGGIGVVAALMILLLGVYEGVKEGATAYIATSSADVWVSQNNSTNLLRSSSLLRSGVTGQIVTVTGVRSVGSILRVLTTARVRGETVTLFLLGITPEDEVCYPTALLENPVRLRVGEMIVDRTFAMKHGLEPGDSIFVQGRAYRIAGCSSRTNAIVAQLAFCTLQDAQLMLGFPGLTSFFPLRLEPESDPSEVARRLQDQIPGVAAFTKREFLENTIRELETGLLPVLWAIALLGMTVGGAVITLLLFGSVIDHRADYALLKALGARRATVLVVVLLQALMAAGSGAAVGLLAAASAAPLLADLVPEISFTFQIGWVVWVFVACVLMAFAGVIAPMRTLTGIDPEEVFRS